MDGALVTALPDADAVEGGEELVAGHGGIVRLAGGWWVRAMVDLIAAVIDCPPPSLPPLRRGREKPPGTAAPCRPPLTRLFSH